MVKRRLLYSGGERLQPNQVILGLSEFRNGRVPFDNANGELLAFELYLSQCLLYAVQVCSFVLHGVARAHNDIHSIVLR